MNGSDLIFEMRKFFGEGWRLENRESFQPFFDKLHSNPGQEVEFSRNQGREMMIVTWNKETDQYTTRYLI